MRPRIRSLLLLPLLGAILLEALALVRPALFRAVHHAYPEVGLDEEGRVLYYDVRFEGTPGGELRPVYSLDESRNDAETLRLDSTAALARLSFRGPGLGGASGPDFDRPRFLRELRDPEDWFVPYSALESLAKNTLNAVEKRRRLLPVEAWTTSGERRMASPIEWNVERNRLVCRETATGRVVAGLGPDGYARGERAEEGERFGRIEVGPIRVTAGASTPADWVPQFLFDRDARKIHVVSMPKEQEGGLPQDSVEPATLSIETRPLHPFQPGEGAIATWPYASIKDRHVLVFLEDGAVVADFDMQPDEAALFFSNALVVQAEGSPGMHVMPGTRQRTAPAAVGIQTALAADALDSERRRLRLFRPGQPEIVRDIVLVPTRGSEVLLANLAAALTLLLPPPLAVASSLSPLPTARWWWRDPWLAGGSYPDWLILSLALAAFCAWRARRAARERCATRRDVRFWTAAVFLLGPIGLLWMRFVLPRVPVEAVGDSRRAVNLDVSPSTREPWPEPKPLGIEVFS